MRGDGVAQTLFPNGGILTTAPGQVRKKEKDIYALRGSAQERDLARKDARIRSKNFLFRLSPSMNHLCERKRERKSVNAELTKNRSQVGLI